MRLKHKFVEFIPEEIEEGIIYISIEYCTAIHKCVCGCKNDIVTPISPTDWQLIFDGDSISLEPSIGNWSYECKSHYWIIRNEVYHSRQWSKEEIEAGRKAEKKAQRKYYQKKKKKSVVKFKSSMEELIVDIEDKQRFLESYYPFENAPKLTDKRRCIHCDEIIIVGDFKVFRDEEEDIFICCPNAPDCDGTVIDWIGVE